MSQYTCSVATCDTDMSGKYLRKGYCEKHYYSWRKYGTPTPSKEQRKTARVKGTQRTLQCEVCGGVFQAVSASAKYCGSKCRVLARPGLPPLYCADCTKRIPNSKTSAPQGKARCSDCINGGRGYYIDERGGRWSHGGSAYSVGCRCRVCKDAQAQGMRDYAAKRVAERGVAPSVEYRRSKRGHDPFKPVFGNRRPVPCAVCGGVVRSVKPAGEAVHKRCRGAGDSWYISEADRLAIYERDGWDCRICLQPVDRDAHFLSDWYPTLDHVVPQSVRVDHSPENLRLCCRYCNLARLDRPVSDDHLVRSWAVARRSLEVV